MAITNNRVMRSRITGYFYRVHKLIIISKFELLEVDITKERNIFYLNKGQKWSNQSTRHQQFNYIYIWTILLTPIIIIYSCINSITTLVQLKFLPVNMEDFQLAQ